MLCKLKNYICRFLPHVLSLSISMASLKLPGHCLVSAGGQYASVNDGISTTSVWVDTGLSESGHIVCMIESWRRWLWLQVKPPNPTMALITKQYLQVQVTQRCLLAWQGPFQTHLDERTLFKEIIQVGNWSGSSPTPPERLSLRAENQFGGPFHMKEVVSLSPAYLPFSIQAD